MSKTPSARARDVKRFAGVAIITGTLLVGLHFLRGGIIYTGTLYFDTACAVPKDWIDARPCIVQDAVWRLSPDLYSTAFMSVAKHGLQLTFDTDPTAGFNWHVDRVETIPGRQTLSWLVMAFGIAAGIVVSFNRELHNLLARARKPRTVRR